MTRNHNARAVHIAEHARAAFLWPREESEKAADFADASVGYGLQSIGLFGEWPKVLERAGWIVQRAEAFDESVLKQADLLVVASPPKEWRDGEVERVARWAASREVELFERAFGRRLEVPAG